MRDTGIIEQLGRGLFRRVDSAGDADPGLLEIAYRAPQATLCLNPALARHGLSDAIPARIDVALPRGQRRPRTQAPVTWHTFAADTFDLGRHELQLAPEMSIGLYSEERCIIDWFRLRPCRPSNRAVQASRQPVSNCVAHPIDPTTTRSGSQPRSRNAFHAV